MYDLGLYVLFVNVKLYEHEGGAPPQATSPRLGDEEMTELHDLHNKDSSDTGSSKLDTPEEESPQNEHMRLAPQHSAGVRRRSPSPSPFSRSIGTRGDADISSNPSFVFFLENDLYMRPVVSEEVTCCHRYLSWP